MVDFDPTQGDEDPEFGAPEEVSIDLNRQINHLMQSFSSDNIQLHWKISQHAAEIDFLKMKLAETESERDALNVAYQSEMEHSRKLEGLLERGGVYLPDIDTDPAQAERALGITPADDHPQEDAILQMTAALSGRPGLGGDGQ